MAAVLIITTAVTVVVIVALVSRNRRENLSTGTQKKYVTY